MARTASPATSPVVASIPEGTSQATTGASWPFIAAMAPAAGSRTSPEKPVPRTASTMTAEPSRDRRLEGRGRRAGKALQVGGGVTPQVLERRQR